MPTTTFSATYLGAFPNHVQLTTLTLEVLTAVRLRGGEITRISMTDLFSDGTTGNFYIDPNKIFDDDKNRASMIRESASDV